MASRADCSCSWWWQQENLDDDKVSGAHLVSSSPPLAYLPPHTLCVSLFARGVRPQLSRLIEEIHHSFISEEAPNDPDFQNIYST